MSAEEIQLLLQTIWSSFSLQFTACSFHQYKSLQDHTVIYIMVIKEI